MSEHPSLHWHVAPRAVAEGYSTVPALAQKMEINRQSVYPIWTDKSGYVRLPVYAKLCKALNAFPGDWFRWDGDRLVWKIAGEITSRGMNQSALHFRSEVHLPTIGRMHSGKMIYVNLQSLARVAIALNEIRPFETGDLLKFAVPHIPQAEPGKRVGVRARRKLPKEA